MFTKKRKKKPCKASEGTKKLREGHKNFRNFLKEIRQSAIEAQKENGKWLKLDEPAEG